MASHCLFPRKVLLHSQASVIMPIIHTQTYFHVDSSLMTQHTIRLRFSFSVLLTDRSYLIDLHSIAGHCSDAIICLYSNGWDSKPPLILPSHAAQSRCSLLSTMAASPMASRPKTEGAPELCRKLHHSDDGGITLHCKYLEVYHAWINPSQ